MRLDPDLLALVSARRIGALATIKDDGRPQLSPVNFTLNTATATARISVIDGLVTTANLRRDPRASIFVAHPDGWTYAVLEGTVELSPVALVCDDQTVAELMEVFRAILGEGHPNWIDYREQMVAEARMVARLRVQSVYGLDTARYARPA